jgi:hypothetical protein
MAPSLTNKTVAQDEEAARFHPTAARSSGGVKSKDSSGAIAA